MHAHGTEGKQDDGGSAGAPLPEPLVSYVTLAGTPLTAVLGISW